MTKSFFGETGPTATPPVTASIPVQSDAAQSQAAQSQNAQSQNAQSQNSEANSRQAQNAQSGDSRSQEPVAADSSRVRFDDASVRRIFFRRTRASA